MAPRAFDLERGASPALLWPAEEEGDGASQTAGLNGVPMGEVLAEAFQASPPGQRSEFAIAALCEQLRRIPYFEPRARRDSLPRLCQVARLVVADPGEVLASQGTWGRDTFLLLTGKCSTHLDYAESGKPRPPLDADEISPTSTPRGAAHSAPSSPMSPAAAAISALPPTPGSGSPGRWGGSRARARALAWLASAAAIVRQQQEPPPPPIDPQLLVEDLGDQLATLSPGDAFGEYTSLMGERRMVSLAANARSALLVIDRRDVIALSLSPGRQIPLQLRLPYLASQHLRVPPKLGHAFSEVRLDAGATLLAWQQPLSHCYFVWSGSLALSAPHSTAAAGSSADAPPHLEEIAHVCAGGCIGDQLIIATLTPGSSLGRKRRGSSRAGSDLPCAAFAAVAREDVVLLAASASDLKKLPKSLAMPLALAATERQLHHDELTRLMRSQPKRPKRAARPEPSSLPPSSCAATATPTPTTKAGVTPSMKLLVYGREAALSQAVSSMKAAQDRVERQAMRETLARRRPASAHASSSSSSMYLPLPKRPHIPERFRNLSSGNLTQVVAGARKPQTKETMELLRKEMHAAVLSATKVRRLPPASSFAGLKARAKAEDEIRRLVGSGRAAGGLGAGSRAQRAEADARVAAARADPSAAEWAVF